MANNNKELKLYYSINEVAEMLNMPESQLRYWEKMFPDNITPKKVGRNIRQYRKEDIENIRTIYHLVREKGMTLAGARQVMKNDKNSVEKSADVVARLRSIREELVQMRKELDYVV